MMDKDNSGVFENCNNHIREKLVELIEESRISCGENGVRINGSRDIADHLIANGVTIQKEGIWIGEGDGYADGEIVYDVWYCGNCNHCIDDGTDDYDLLPNFCPSCGMKKLPLPEPPKGEADGHS